MVELFVNKFYEVEVHQAAVEGTLWLDASEFVFLLLGAEQVIEVVALVEGEIALLVVGIDEEETAAGLVERVNEPCLDETEHVAAQVLALEIGADAEAPNHHGRITAVEFFARDVLLDLLLARAGNFLDAVVGKGEGCDDGRGVVVERKTIVLAEQLVALQEGIAAEELVKVVIATMERLALVSLLLRVESETAFLLEESHRS